MSKHPPLFVLLVLALGGGISGCARATWHAPQALPADTLYLPAAPAKIKASGSVTLIYQSGQGQQAHVQASVVDNTKAGQRQGAAATAPAAAATGATVTHQGLPGWLWVLFGIGCCALGWQLSRWREGR